MLHEVVAFGTCAFCIHAVTHIWHPHHLPEWAQKSRAQDSSDYCGSGYGGRVGRGTRVCDSLAQLWGDYPMIEFGQWLHWRVERFAKWYDEVGRFKANPIRVRF